MGRQVWEKDLEFFEFFFFELWTLSMFFLGGNSLLGPTTPLPFVMLI